MQRRLAVLVIWSQVGDEKTGMCKVKESNTFGVVVSLDVQGCAILIEQLSQLIKCFTGIHGDIFKDRLLLSILEFWQVVSCFSRR